MESFGWMKEKYASRVFFLHPTNILQLIKTLHAKSRPTKGTEDAFSHRSSFRAKPARPGRTHQAW
jgi:hypothetical protein